MSLFNKLFGKPLTPQIIESTPIIHPYYPLGVEIANYIANEKDVPTLIFTFFSGCAVILSLAWYSTSFVRKMKVSDKLIMLWFILTGTIHLFFEGYFAYNHSRMGPAQDLFGQLWKEYSMSDSRYLTSDPFVLCMETITAIAWGPLSYLMVYYIVTSHPLRYPLQIIVSLGQIYGDILYYATSLFDLYYKGYDYCRPEPYYFWFYFFFMNFIWIVIPGLLLYQGLVMSYKAFAALSRMSKSLQANGTVVHTKANGHVKSA